MAEWMAGSSTEVTPMVEAINAGRGTSRTTVTDTPIDRTIGTRSLVKGLASSTR